MRKIKSHSFFSVSWMMFIGACCACHMRTAVLPGVFPPHQVEIREKGIGMIYVDRVPNSVVMKNGQDTSSFVSYLVGFQDSNAISNPAKRTELGRYYQYEMYRDWALVSRQDSMAPVFYQDRRRPDAQNRETILVFELPAGRSADTLVFRDGLNYWGKHIIYVNQQ